jgi:hypothetical protein
VLRSAQRGGRRGGGGHTWWVLVGGEGPGEDVAKGAAARPVVAAPKGRPGERRGVSERGWGWGWRGGDEGRPLAQHQQAARAGLSTSRARASQTGQARARDDLSRARAASRISFDELPTTVEAPSGSPAAWWAWWLRPFSSRPRTDSPRRRFAPAPPPSLRRRAAPSPVVRALSCVAPPGRARDPAARVNPPASR